MAALAEARRRIQTIVEDGRKRVKLRTRTRIARWENAGKGEMLPREARVTTSEANATDLNPEQASLLWSPQDDSDDWSVDFSLPRSRGDFNSTGDKNDD